MLNQSRSQRHAAFEFLLTYLPDTGRIFLRMVRGCLSLCEAAARQNAPVKKWMSLADVEASGSFLLCKFHVMFYYLSRLHVLATWESTMIALSFERIWAEFSGIGSDSERVRASVGQIRLCRLDLCTIDAFSQSVVPLWPIISHNTKQLAINI